MNRIAKRTLSLLLALALTLSLVSVGAFASDGDDELIGELPAEAEATISIESVEEDPEEGGKSEEAVVEEATELPAEEEALPEEDDEPAPDTITVEEELPDEKESAVGADRGTEAVGFVGRKYTIETELNEDAPERPLLFASSAKITAYEEEEETLDWDDGALVLRDELLNRTASFKVRVSYFWDGSQAIEDYADAAFSWLFHDACFHDPDDPDKGDYLYYNIRSVGGKYSYMPYADPGSVVESTFTYNVEYYTTCEEEDWVSGQIADIVSGFGFNTESNYEKLCAIYDWVCGNVTYTKKVDGKYPTICYSTYSALKYGNAVCQGYSSLLYRLALSCGIDARIVTSENMDHAYNIFRLGGLYFYGDATWDYTRYLDKQPYDYFLRGSENWVKEIPAKHELGDEFADPAFAEKYIVSTKDYSADILSGTVNGLSWYIDVDSHTLHLAGSGALNDFARPEDAPWTGYIDKINTVSVDEGVSSVGENAFASCTAIQSLILPLSLHHVGKNAVVGDTLSTFRYNGCEGSYEFVTIETPNDAIRSLKPQMKPHTYTDYTVAATCTEGGSVTHVCDYCHTYYTDYTDPLGHSFSGNVCRRCTYERPSIRFSSTSSSVNVGSSVTFRVSVSAMQDGQYLVWSSSGSAVSLQPSGDSLSCTVTGSSTGSVRITAVLHNADGSVNAEGGTVSVSSGISVKAAPSPTPSGGGSIIQTILQLLNPLTFISTILGIFFR